MLKSILSYAEDQGTAVHRKAALSDYRRLQDQGHQDVRFLLQGHTHVPDQCPLDRLKDAVGIYFNTGTWRPMFHETLAVEDGCKYVQLKHVTYLVLYGKNEDTAGTKNDTPSCDVWTAFGYKR